MRPVFCVLLVLLLVAAGCEQAPTDPLGEAFAKECAYCHKLDGTGTKRFPPLTGPNLQTERIARIVLHGLKGPIEVDGKAYDEQMAAFGGRLDDATIAQIIAHVQTRFGGGSSDVTPDAVAKIREATKGRTDPWTATELEALAPATAP